MIHPPEYYMQLAMNQAEKARAKGGFPVGCVIIDDTGNIVAQDHDRVQEKIDPSAHAEMNCIRKLCKKLNQTKLENYSLFVTSEPCPVCMGMCIRTKIKHVYYGAKTEKTASLPIPAELLLSFATDCPIHLHPDILSKECLHQRKLQ